MFCRCININLALEVRKSDLEELVFAKSDFLDLANFLLILALTKSDFLNYAKFLLILAIDKYLAFTLASQPVLLRLIFLMVGTIILFKLVFYIKISDIAIL